MRGEPGAIESSISKLEGAAQPGAAASGATDGTGLGPTTATWGYIWGKKPWRRASATAEAALEAQRRQKDIESGAVETTNHDRGQSPFHGWKNVHPVRPWHRQEWEPTNSAPNPPPEKEGGGDQEEPQQ